MDILLQNSFFNFDSEMLSKNLSGETTEKEIQDVKTYEDTVPEILVIPTILDEALGMCMRPC